VVAPVAYEFGATPLDMGVAAMMGQALHFASPLVAFIYVLVDRTQITFAEYAKEFLKWAWPIFPLYVAAAAATGALPL
jgi:CitMHS family citrate-Mg2+:H+ or citrate-Ca2+:H+ symporter